MENLKNFLSASYTAYQACENAKKLLLSQGFKQLSETEDWAICEEGKYFVERGGSSLIAFTIGNLDNFSYKIVASHTDSPMLKIKENPAMGAGACTTLNVETYGGGIWYSFFDRPLKIAGRVVKNEDGRIYSELVESPFLVHIPSVAIHQNRSVNESFSVNAQVDLCPLFSLGDKPNEIEFIQKVTGAENVLSYDLFLVNATLPYAFGANEEFLAAPRIDNLTSVYASLQALCTSADSDGVCVAAVLDNEEIGSATAQGAGGNFLESVLKRIAYAFHFDDNELYKAFSNSFLLSVDNAHAVHPNHPEKSDPTNKAVLGGGVVIKSHASGAYATNGISAAMIKTVFKNAEIKHQSFFNRSDVRSGSTLGVIAAKNLGMLCADIGIAQLAMHSACECFAIADYTEMVNGLNAFFQANILVQNDEVMIR